MSLTHNTLRGAASGALLNAELLVVQGFIGRNPAQSGNGHQSTDARVFQGVGLKSGEVGKQ
jgi:hypothetical protein